jgi:sugar/nucleoside kinase (ribokinase family)/D-arabinose 5-phosphate isomerase GutQ
MEKQFDLVGIGSMVVDLIYRTPRIIGQEEKISLLSHPGGEAVKKLVGGVAINHLSWARLLGLRVGIFGRQADDEYGRFLRAGMAQHGIDHHLQLDGSTSSFAHIFVDPTGGRAIYMNPATTAETTGAQIREHHQDYIAQGRIVSTEISQLPLDAVVEVLEIARATGALTALDIDIPRSDALRSLGSADEFERALLLADILKPSKSAVLEITGESDALRAAELLRQRYHCRAVVITDGERGCAISSEEYCDRVATTPLDAIDTTGAGDAFFGGLLAGLHYRLSWPDLLALANACGAACCEIVGATPDQSTSLSRVLARYRGATFLPSHQERLPTALDSADDPYAGAVTRFLDTARREIDRLATQWKGPDSFEPAVRLITNAEERGGRLHVTGIGKPSHVAGYIAALLSSVGTPAYYLDATECVHGSAGQVRPGDVVIAISNSGQTKELRAAIVTLQRNQATIIGVTGNSSSWLATEADCHLLAGVESEGSPLGLEPRASILAEIYLLAALSVELQSRKRLDRHQYHRWHPGGSIGEATRS